MTPPAAISFDFGQTLCVLDTAMLAARLAERGVTIDADTLAGSEHLAFARYDAALRAGVGDHPWQLFMHALLEQAGVAPEAREAVVPWLWSEQPRRNLWRRPIPGMIELVRRIGLPVGILSNSEGKLAELVAEVGWTADFRCVADSGVLGMAKPARGIFEWTAGQLGVPLAGLVHVGDLKVADVEGALAAGCQAVWFGPAARGDQAPAGAHLARDARELESVLRALGVPLAG